MNKDPYDILGVKKDATDDEIKKAYRRLSKEFHPDLNKDKKDAVEKFKEINTAYEILGDKQKRAQYDQFGSAAFGGGHGDGGGFGGFDFSGFQGAGGGFADIFESFFGGSTGGQPRQRNYRGQDLEVRLTIDFIEAIFGANKVIAVNKDRGCETCDGKGIEKGSRIITCDECRGTGSVRSVRNTILGQIQSNSTCQKCHGEGQIPEKPCGSCRGSGVNRSSENITIKIPAGVSDGTTLRLSGKGGAGMKGHTAGDLYVQIRVKSSSEFQRKGDDIYTEKTIHVLQAILGDEVELETVHGPVKLEIPPGTQPNQSFRIKGSGAPKLNSSQKGDHYVSIRLEIPKKLMNTEEEHYKELAKLAKLSTKSKDKSFFSKLFS
ncbi:MAG: molecular chaperone DnaJ [bacterium]|nr:molecular chaperone DnaJ [bacterium]